jgi:hypothetical protein
MKYYAIIGKAECICSTYPPTKRHIEMGSPNRFKGIARPDGTWSTPIKNKSMLVEEYVSKYYTQNEVFRILTVGTDDEKVKLGEVFKQADELAKK